VGSGYVSTWSKEIDAINSSYGRSRLVVGIILVLVAALLFLLGEGTFTTAGAVAIGVLGLASIAVSRKGARS